MEFPKRIRITEVGPRDGFQSLEDWIETPVKVGIVRRLFSCGIGNMEVTSFISPRAIPQMRDAEQVIAALRPKEMGRAMALIAGRRGAARAREAGLTHLTMVISASNAHNMSNVRKTPEQSLKELEEIREEFPEVRIKLSLATAFGCPFQGPISDREIYFVIDGAVSCGVDEICLCDTIGSAVPPEVSRLGEKVRERYAGRGLSWSFHLHNTRGLAAANTLAAMEQGFSHFETAIGGLGGCPFAPGASGNMATEDLVYLAGRMGIETGIDLTGLVETAEYVRDTLGCRIDSRINAATVRTVPCREKVRER